VFKRIVAVYTYMCMCCLNTLAGGINMLIEGLMMMSINILKGTWLLKESIVELK